MKIEHAEGAVHIARGLAKIRKERRALSAGVESAGLRLKNNSEWITFPDSWQPAVLALVRADLDRREAEFVRLANQIGLIL